jgi:DNA-binding MarR family transcriptional regulator
MDDYDKVIHQPIRLQIMAALTSLEEDEQLNFVDLRLLVKATDGNLGAHLQKLEEAEYIKTEKAFVDRKPRTWVRATSEGTRAYQQHVQFLRNIVGETQ